MQAQNLYQELRLLYTSKKDYEDAFSVAPELENLVGTILREIVSPLYLEANPRIRDSGLDWRLKLGQSRVALLELVVGNITSFRLRKFIDIASVISDISPSNLYFVAIGKGTEESGDWFSKLARLEELGAHLTIIDFESLITLHHYALKSSKNLPKHQVSRFKRAFLRFLLAKSGKLTEEGFHLADELARGSLERAKAASGISLNQDRI